ncbi:MAG: GTP-binding protein TypA/BipA [Deltaproteobacteria bacterium ADurb.Bin510]|nr:MAG: GTP-binding protein TypA/BipA [Deltaproteobacteria bacterium ADurb.Bin510]
MRKDSIRNIAIIAHVDHGKTTLVDYMLRQSGTFGDHQKVDDRVMDSMDLERERGITISAKNTAIFYDGIKINIVDTPGHADFGGEVERSLNMVDGAILLVDSSEGTIAREGVAHRELNDGNTDLKPLFDTIIKTIPGPEADDAAVPQFLVTSLDYDSYVGQIAIGRLANGQLSMNKNYALITEENIQRGVKFSALYSFSGLKKQMVETAEAGDIIAVAGLTNVHIGDTVSSEEEAMPLPRINVDEPTVSMIFYVNNGPFAGQEGKFLTSRHLKARLEKETLWNVAIRIKELERADAFEVCGRGELQMAILIETMRREGYEFMVSKPKVITKEIDGKVHEPMEHVYIDVPEEYVGIVTEKLATRKGRMESLLNNGGGRVNLEFVIPSRGLIGFRSQFMTDTKGAGVMNTLFEGYEPWFGPIPQRQSGAMVADRAGKATGYAVIAMLDRGELFIKVGTPVYAGMVIGERNKTGDLEVNITKEKQLTNMRAAGSDNTVTIRPPRLLSLDQAIEFIAEDELVEVTPENIRLRKMELDSGKRYTMAKKAKFGED